MAYNGGKLPVESASKIAHMEMIRDPQLTLLLQDFNADAVPSGSRLMPGGRIDLGPTPPIDRVITIDGGMSIVPNPARREKTLGLARVGAFILKLSDYYEIARNPMMDPRDMREYLNNVQAYTVAVPMAGVRIPNLSIRQTNRVLLNGVLSPAHTGLYDTLEFLLFEGWLPPGSSAEPQSILCDACDEGFPLARARSFSCPHCGHGHTLSDALNLFSEDAEDWAREGTLSMVMAAVETLLLFKLPARLTVLGKFDLLSRHLFVKDGPLMMRAGGARLVKAIRKYLAWMVAEGHPLNLVGIEKTGDLAAYLDAYRNTLVEPGDFVFPSIRELYEEVSGLAYNSNVRNRVSYGHRIGVMLSPSHRVALQVPARVMGDTRPEDFPVSELVGLETAVRTLARLTSSAYDNAVLPLTLANSAVSLSQGVSTRILDDYVGSLVVRS